MEMPASPTSGSEADRILVVEGLEAFSSAGPSWKQGFLETFMRIHGALPLVFLLAWSKGGAKPGELVAGAGPEVFRKFLDQISAVGASGSFESA